MQTRLCLVLIVLMLAACAATDEPKANQRYATLVTNFALPSTKMMPVEISRIDDRRLNLGDFDPQSKRFEFSRSTHRIKPGPHTIDAIAIVRDAVSSSRLSGLDRPSLPLTANFESGRRYYLALQRNDVERRRWELVIWKVEDSKGGLLKLE